MLLKFTVQRQAIITAGSWDKNPIVHGTAIWCCYRFPFIGGRKRANGQQGNQNLSGNPACPLVFDTSSSVSDKKTTNRIHTEFPKLKSIDWATKS